MFCGVYILSKFQLPSSYSAVYDLGYFEGLEEKDHWMVKGDMWQVEGYENSLNITAP